MTTQTTLNAFELLSYRDDRDSAIYAIENVLDALQHGNPDELADPLNAMRAARVAAQGLEALLFDDEDRKDLADLIRDLVR